MFRTDTALGNAPTDTYPFCSGIPSGVSWLSLNESFAVTQFYYGTVFPGGAAYFGGTQDNGTPIGNDANGVNGWGHLYYGDGGQVEADPIDTSTLFVENTRLSISKSTNGGYSGHSATGGITEPGTNFNFINYFTYDPNDPLKMYTGGKQMWRSVDGAESWTAASAPVGSSLFGISVEAVDPSDFNTVYFGSNSGAWVSRTSNALTTDGTTIWPATQLRSTGFISGIFFDPHLPARLYATVATFRQGSGDAQIYLSDDRGVTWAPIGNGPSGLQDVPVTAMVVDPDNSATLYVGTDIGLFVSYDGGNTWAQAAAPFADAWTTALRMDYEGPAKVLYAFTFGRGVWRMNLNGGAACTYSVSPSSIAATADESEGFISVTAPAGCPWSAQSGTQFATVEGPANGVGPGQVFYRIPYNSFGNVLTDTLYVQGIPVPIQQTAAPSVVHSGHNDEVATANVVNALPYGDAVDVSSFTSNSTDPVHSCTGSADLSTAWYTFAATQTGSISISATGDSFLFYGGVGVILTAYPLQGTVLGKEIVCTTAPAIKDAVTTLNGQFQAQAGQSYAIEVSVPNAEFANIQVDITQAVIVAVTPPTVQINPGGTAQFVANVAGSSNTGVRWSVAPAQAGTISVAGLFTASTTLTGPATVTARSYADGKAVGSATINGAVLAPSLSLDGITNAASFKNGPIAPGEMITIFGTSVGPATIAGLQLDANGNLSTSVGNTQVTFDGVPAPIIYALSGQLTVVAPYEIAGETYTQVVVTYNGQPSPAVMVPVTNAFPALFTLDASGSGNAALLNQDYSINGPSNGAPLGSVVALFGTGEGVTNPAGVDGKLANGSILPMPTAPVVVQIGGLNAVVEYAGAAPGLAAGVFQINVQVPMGLQPGKQPVVVTVGDGSSPANVFLSVL